MPSKAVGAGPLGPHLLGFRGWLVAAGRLESLVEQRSCCARHFDWWLQAQGVPIEAVSAGVVERFFAHLPSCGCPCSRPGKHLHTRNGVRSLLVYLRTQGVIAQDDGQADRTRPRNPPILDAFSGWMRARRGVRDRTLVGYFYPLREFIEHVGEGPITVSTLREFILARSERCSITRMKSSVTAIRMFVRFLVTQGRCDSSLVDAIPKIAHWRLATLPRFLSQETIEKLLSQPDVARPVGMRDRAVLLLLARLALRAGDVSALRMTDVDWRAGRIRVSGKSQRQAELPLCQEVGDAVRGYLEKARPPSRDPHVFLTARRPFRLLSPGAVGGIVRHHFRGAGLAPAGSHVMRHSAATEMLRQGMPLDAIGVVLRHQSVETTALYAKVDLPSLKSVVQPWPSSTKSR